MGGFARGMISSTLDINFSTLQIFCPVFSVICNDGSEILLREPIPCFTLFP